jgi:MFS family permease
MQQNPFTPYIPTGLYSFCLQALFLLLPLSVVEAGHSPSLAAMILGVRGIGLLAMDIPSGYLLDRFGNFIGLIVGSSIFLAGYALIILVNEPNLMILGGLIIGIGMSLAQIGRQGFIAFHLKHISVGIKLSRLGSAVRFGSLFGPLLAALLADHFGYSFSFNTLLILVALSYLVEIRILIISSIPRHPSTTKQTISAVELKTYLHSQRKQFLTTSSLIFLLQCLRSAKLLLIPLVGISLNISISSIGIAVALGTLLDCIISTRAGYIMDKYGRRVSALPSILGLSIGFLFLGIATDYVFFVIAILILGLSDGISAGLVLVLAADLSPKQKGRSQFLALIKLISDGGLALSPLLISYLLLFMDIGVVTLVTLILGVLGFIYMYFQFEETKDLSNS